MRAAGFPFLRTVEEFDFAYQSTLRLTSIGSLLAPDFVTEGSAVILEGKPGRGKTHLAVAIAYRALHNGFDALFTTCADLIDDLSTAGREGRLRDAVARYVRPHLVVEVGYLSYGTDVANVLFHVVNGRHMATWSSPPTKSPSHGAPCCTTMISPTPSSTASSIAAASSASTGPPSEPGTCPTTR